MKCTYTIDVGGRKIVLLENVEQRVDTLTELLALLRESDPEFLSDVLNQIRNPLVSSPTTTITENFADYSVGTFTPAELIQQISPKRRKILQDLKINNKYSQNLIVGFADENVQTKFLPGEHGGKIFVNLNYVSEEASNIIALIEAALFENDIDVDLYEKVANKENIMPIVSQIVKKESSAEAVKNLIEYAYFKTDLLINTEHNNSSTTRNNLNDVFDKFLPLAQDLDARDENYLPSQEVHISSLKEGDLVLINTSDGSKHWYEIFYDYFIDEEGTLVMRTVQSNSEGVNSLRYRTPNIKRYSGKTSSVSVSEKVKARIYDEEVHIIDSKKHTGSNYEKINLSKNRLNINVLLNLIKNEDVEIGIKETSTSKKGKNYNTDKFYKVKSVKGSIVTLDNDATINVANIKNIRIGNKYLEDLSLSYSEDNFIDGFNAPSVSDVIYINKDDTQILGKVISANTYGSYDYLYLDEKGKVHKDKIASKDILATRRPSNIHTIPQTTYSRIEKYIKNKLIKSGGKTFKEAVLNNRVKRGLNKNYLGISAEQVHAYTSLMQGDYLLEYNNNNLYYIVESTKGWINGRDIFYVKVYDITNDTYKILPKELLDNHIVLTDRVNPYFAKRSALKNTIEVFNNTNEEGSYAEVKVRKLDNGLVWIHEGNFTEGKDYTDEYYKEMAARFGWKIPRKKSDRKLYAKRQHDYFKKDTVNTRYYELTADDYSKLFKYNSLGFIPGGFITLKGDADAYIIEKVFGDKILIGKYSYTSVDNIKNDPAAKRSGDTEFINSEKILLTKEDASLIQGIHIPRWATESMSEIASIKKGNEMRIRQKYAKTSMNFNTDVFDSKEVIANLSNYLQERFGIKVNIIGSKDISDPNLRGAAAFTDGSEIFINIDKANIADPLHEVMHIIMATMKATDSDTYYSLVNSVQSHPLFHVVAKHYDEINAEILEETFVNLFSKTFRRNIIKHNTFDNEIFETGIKNTVSDMLALSESLDNETAFSLLGKSLKEVLEDFGSQLILNEESLIDNYNVKMMFGISEVIRDLLHSGDLEQKCNY